MILEEISDPAAELADGEILRWMSRQVVRRESVKALVPDHGVNRGKVFCQTIEQTEEVHVSVDAQPLDGAEALVATDEALEPIGESPLATGKVGETVLDPFRRADQSPDDFLCLDEIRHR